VAGWQRAYEFIDPGGLLYFDHRIVGIDVLGGFQDLRSMSKRTHILKCDSATINAVILLVVNVSVHSRPRYSLTMRPLTLLVDGAGSS
jgi:hypothetical protein